MSRLSIIAAVMGIFAVSVWANTVEEIAEQAAIASLRGDTPALAEARRELQFRDTARHGMGEDPTGLLDNVMALEALAASDRGPGLGERLLEAAGESGTPAERRRMRRMAETRVWPTIQRLRWENSYNRVAAFFNTVAQRTTRLFIAPMETVTQIGIDVIFIHRAFLKPTVHENRIAVEIDHLARNAPDSPEAQEAMALLERIQVKQEWEKRREVERRARLAGELGQWEMMFALAESGLILWPDDEPLREHLLEADHQVGMRRRGWERSLLVLPEMEVGLNEDEWVTLGDGLRDILLGQGTASLAEWTDSPGNSERRREHGTLLIASALGRTGSSEAAAEMLRDDELWLTESLREGPVISPVAGLQRAEQRREELTSRYIWTGARTLDQNLHMASSSAVAQGLEAPISLGFFHIVDATVRRLALAIRNPIGADLVLDELRTLERRQGLLTEEQLIRRRDLLMETGDMERAIVAQRAIDPQDTKRLQRLHSQWGDSLMAAANQMDRPEQRRRLLTVIVDRCRGTRAAEDAWRELQRTPWPGVNLTLEEIQGHGLALAALGFPLPGNLWDGDSDNGEIDEEGIWLSEEGTLHWRLHREEQWETVSVATEDAARLSAAFESIALGSEVDEILLQRTHPRVPLAISGGVGSAGVNLSPRLQTIRPAERDLPLYQ